MAQTQRKPVYIKPEHHDILRKVAFEQRCNLSDVLDAILEQTDWDQVEKNASMKPEQRVRERGAIYKV